MPKTPKTTIELANWMTANCYNFIGYSINGNIIYEGFGLEKSGGLYHWYYTERGQKNHLKSFEHEDELIAYAFQHIKEDQWANAHCIGFTSNQSKKNELTSILDAIQITYLTDQIPYNKKPVYRVYVFGCDKLKVTTLEGKYMDKKDF